MDSSTRQGVGPVGTAIREEGSCYPASSGIATIETRSDLARFARGIAVELGVARGDYSLELLANPAVEVLYSIDRWSDHHNDAEMRVARNRLSRYGSRSVIVRAAFEDAVARFADGFFDFIYIDGYAHTGQDGGRTLRDWWPKLRSGGIFAGHDYCVTFPETVEAVDRFAAEHGVKVALTLDPLASWWLAT